MVQHFPTFRDTLLHSVVEGTAFSTPLLECLHKLLETIGKPYAFNTGGSVNGGSVGGMVVPVDGWLLGWSGGWLVGF